jgi:RIO kinase 1
MKAPESLETLVDYGIIQEVIRPLMSGKEAHVYLVIAGGEECVAKVYKEANNRTFKHRSDYTEGRRTRNSRDQRAINKRTVHGRKKDEDAWRDTEVDMIYRLRDAGVRVPEPINYVEGVLVMELVRDGEGLPAPRLGDLTFSASEATEIYHQLLREVVRMLCAGVIHGDLSEFNVLMTPAGPVVIDFPQSVDPTHNTNAQKLFLRDVENLDRFLARSAPSQPRRSYGREIWALFQANQLQPDSKLSGHYAAPTAKADTEEVMALIEDATRDQESRSGGGDLDDDEDFESSARSIVKAPAPFRKVVDFSSEGASRPAKRRQGRAPSKASSKAQSRAPSKARAKGRRPATSDKPIPPSGPKVDSVAKPDGAPAGRRRRRGGKNFAAPARAPKDQASESGAVAAEGSESPRTRRRGRRTGSRRPASTDASAKSESPKADLNASTASEQKKPSSPSRGRASARAADDASGRNRPRRRTRRGPRKASAPE